MRFLDVFRLYIDNLFIDESLIEGYGEYSYK